MTFNHPSSAPGAIPGIASPELVSPAPRTAFYVGWFGVFDDSHPAGCPSCFVVRLFNRRAPTRLTSDGVRELFAVGLLYGNNLTRRGCSSSNAIGLHFTPIWAASSWRVDLYNGGPYQADHLPLFDWHCSAGCGREVGLSYRAGHASFGSLWDLLSPSGCCTVPCLAAGLFGGQGSFSRHALGHSSRHLNFMLVLQAEHNVLNATLPQCWEITCVFGGALFSRPSHGLTSSPFTGAGDPPNRNPSNHG